MKQRPIPGPRHRRPSWKWEIIVALLVVFAWLAFELVRWLVPEGA